MGVIRLEGIAADCLLGILPEERLACRSVSVDITACLDLSRASVSDDISDTVDTRELASLVVSTVTTSHDGLVERLAGRIADEIMRSFQRIESVDVTVHKPDSLQECHGVAVTITRCRIQP